MSGKDKFLVVLLTIVTLGLIWIWWSKKKNHNVENELSVSTKVIVDLSKLEKYLGGKKNIEKVESTHTKVKFYLLDVKKIQLEEIHALKGISGVVASSKYVNVIVGNSASTIAQKFNEEA